MSFQRYGARQIGEWIDGNVRQAKHLHALVAQHADFEAASDPPMSAICIRHRGADPDSTRSKELHGEVARRVERSGRFWISTTDLKGKSWFRINPVNFRTRTEHMDQLLALLGQECQAVLESRQPVNPVAVLSATGRWRISRMRKRPSLDGLACPESKTRAKASVSGYADFFCAICA